MCKRTTTGIGTRLRIHTCIHTQRPRRGNAHPHCSGRSCLPSSLLGARTAVGLCSNPPSDEKRTALSSSFHMIPMTDCRTMCVTTSLANLPTSPAKVRDTLTPSFLHRTVRELDGSKNGGGSDGETFHASLGQETNPRCRWKHAIGKPQPSTFHPSALKFSIKPSTTHGSSSLFSI